MLGIALDERHDVVDPAFAGALAADAQHLAADVEHFGARAGAARFDHPERHVPGSAGHVQQKEWPTFPRRVDRGDERILPGPVQPARHQIVHQVVAPRHPAKNVVDQPLLVRGRDVAETEIDLAFGGSFGHACLRSRGP